MKAAIIESENSVYRYFDREGNELHDGDYIMRSNGKIEQLYLTDSDELGTDATNPAWIKAGRACACEFGIYPLNKSDMSEIVKVNARWQITGVMPNGSESIQVTVNNLSAKNEEEARRITAQNIPALVIKEARLCTC